MNPIQNVVDVALRTGAYRATKYLSANMVVKVTRRHKIDRRARSVEFVLTIGRPNYVERKFINLCRKAKVSLPLQKVQLKFKLKNRAK